jgi:hypothetical protein
MRTISSLRQPKQHTNRCMHYWEAGAAKTACGLSNCHMGTTANVLRVTCKRCLRARVDPACADINFAARRS